MSTLSCEFCKKVFERPKTLIESQKKLRGQIRSYCSQQCKNNYYLSINYLKVACGTCGKEFVCSKRIIKDSKSGLVFCGHSCSATYSNTHKTTGYRRSKLEIYIENKLKEDFKNLEIICNSKTIINSELDFYFPSLKLAVELNGIFHYEPIYGRKKLAQIKNNDNRKFQACLERNIELIIIDTSKVTYLKESIAIEYYSIIANIIKSKLNN